MAPAPPLDFAFHGAKKLPSAVDRIARELRAMALGMSEGDYLGSEAMLGQRFQVSAPTLRQAARLLEHEQVMKVKRGVHGGYFVHRPKIETISRVGATYVRGNPGSLEEFYDLLEALAPFIVDLVIASDRLSELAEFAVPRPAPTLADEFVEQETRFFALLANLTNNRPLELVLSIVTQVGVSIADESPETATVSLDNHNFRIELAASLLTKDREASIGCFLKALRQTLLEIRRAIAGTRSL